MDEAEFYRRLQELSELDADWDGLGADKPDSTAIDRASWLVWVMEDPSRIVAGPNGEIVIERQHNGRLGEIEIEPGAEGGVEVWPRTRSPTE